MSEDQRPMDCRRSTARLLRTIGLSMVTALGCASVSASAQDDLDDNTNLEVSGEVTVVTGLVDGELVSDADALIRAQGTTVLSSGLELGAVAALRADGDAPGYTYAGGRYSSLLAGGPRGFGTNGDVFLEGAYLFARGGFGSVHLGRDAGVARRLAVTSPTIFSAIGVNDWRTDLTGLNDIHTVNDFSGQATKISYMPPPGVLGGVIGQFQMGISYAPILADCSDEGCAPLSAIALDADGQAVFFDAEWRDVLETAVYYQNGIDLGPSPLTFGVSASYVRAEDESSEAGSNATLLAPLFEDYQAYTLGLNLAYGGVTIGGSVKSTNSGLTEDQGDDYLAFDAGLTLERGEWNFMIGYGAADAGQEAGLLGINSLTSGPLADGPVDRQTQTAQAGISYAISQGVMLGAAAQIIDSDKSDALGGEEDAAAIMFESSIKF